MTVGPIPWSSIVKWGELHGLDIDDIAVLEHHIRAMERTLLDHQEKQENKGKVSK